jgi:protein-disulfide isomerase
VKPELIQKYVEDGTLRIEWRDFPALGQESVNAALAARAAQAQGEFWEYHELLFENQSEGFGDEQLVALAREAGRDVEKFKTDFRGGEFEDEVAEDFEEGQNAGVSGTPAFDINGDLIVGLQSLETFEQVIEQAKREAEGG